MGKSEPALLYPQEAEALLNSLWRIKKLTNDKSLGHRARRSRVNHELTTWIGRINQILKWRR